jgi:hypothetical protein
MIDIIQIESVAVAVSLIVFIALISLLGEPKIRKWLKR